MAAALRERSRCVTTLATRERFRSRCFGGNGAAPKYAMPTTAQAPTAPEPRKDLVERRGNSQRRRIAIRTMAVGRQNEREKNRRQDDSQDEEPYEDQRETDGV